MHVSPKHPESVPSVPRTSALRARAAVKAAQAAPRPADSVSISAEARALAASREAVEAAPDVRTDRVADLKQRIASGTYSVPASTLARALLKPEQI